jgi:hypothetical protein
MVGSFQPIALPMTTSDLYRNSSASTTQNTLNSTSNNNNQFTLDPSKVGQLSSTEHMQLRQLLQKTGVPNTTSFGNTPPFGTTQQIDPIGQVQGMGLNIQPTNVGGGSPYMSQEMAGVSISILVAGLKMNPQTGLPLSTPEQVQKLVEGMSKNEAIVRHPSWPQALQHAMMYIQQGNAMAHQNQTFTQQVTQANTKKTQGGTSLQALKEENERLKLLAENQKLRGQLKT